MRRKNSAVVHAKQSCGPQCDSPSPPSLLSSLPPPSTISAFPGGSDLPQGAPLKLLRSISHLLIINPEGPESTVLPRGGGDRSVHPCVCVCGGFTNWHFSIFSEERWGWQRTEKRLGVADEIFSNDECRLKTNCWCLITLGMTEEERRSVFVMCVWLFMYLCSC